MNKLDLFFGHFYIPCLVFMFGRKRKEHYVLELMRTDYSTSRMMESFTDEEIISALLQSALAKIDYDIELAIKFIIGFDLYDKLETTYKKRGIVATHRSRIELVPNYYKAYYSDEIVGISGYVINKSI